MRTLWIVVLAGFLAAIGASAADALVICANTGSGLLTLRAQCLLPETALTPTVLAALVRGPGFLVHYEGESAAVAIAS